MEFRAKIENGKYLGVKPDFTKWEGKEIVLSVKEYKVNRRVEQNNLHWKRLEILANECGYSKNELHKYFKYQFIAVPLFRSLNRELPELTIDKHIQLSKESDLMQNVNILITSTKLNTKEFTNFMNEIEKWSLDNYDLDLTAVSE